MKALTANEIARTAFRGNPPYQGPFPPGYARPSRDQNEICPYCKNDDTDIVRDAAALVPFGTFYGEKKFKVVHCHCCAAVFSFSIPQPIHS